MTDFSYQLYSSRNFPPLADTLKMVAAAGYTQVEGYSGLFSDLSELDTLKGDLADNNLHMATGHFGLEMVRDEPERVLAIAKALNIEAMFVPAVGPDQRSQDAAGWAALGKTLAESGKPIQDAGLTFGWHNHDFEFADIGGDELPLDLILQGSDDLAWEIDVAWVQVGGQDPLKWISKYGNRIVAAHIKDIAPKGECTDEDGWADFGHGIMDWPAIMGALRAADTKYYVIEHDNPNDAQRFAERSIKAAKSL